MHTPHHVGRLGLGRGERDLRAETDRHVREFIVSQELSERDSADRVTHTVNKLVLSRTLRGPDLFVTRNEWTDRASRAHGPTSEPLGVVRAVSSHARLKSPFVKSSFQ